MSKIIIDFFSQVKISGLKTMLYLPLEAGTKSYLLIVTTTIWVPIICCSLTWVPVPLPGRVRTPNTPLPHTHHFECNPPPPLHLFFLLTVWLVLFGAMYRTYILYSLFYLLVISPHRTISSRNLPYSCQQAPSDIQYTHTLQVASTGWWVVYLPLP